MRTVALVGFACQSIACLLSVIACVSKDYEVSETYSDTEYKTEYKTEIYTEIVPVVISSRQGRDSLQPSTKWFNSLYSPGFSKISSTYYYGYQLEPVAYSTAQLKITLARGLEKYQGHIAVYDMTGIGQIPPMPTIPVKFGIDVPIEQQRWMAEMNAKLSAARLLGEVFLGDTIAGSITFDARGIQEFSIFVNCYNSHAISSVQLTWADETVENRTVTKERQVPYQIPYQVQKQRTTIETRKVPFWETIFGSE